MPNGELLTVQQVAERLQVNPETVRRWLRSGQLRGYVLGGDRAGYRVATDDLDAFIRARGIDRRGEIVQFFRAQSPYTVTRKYLQDTFHEPWLESALAELIRTGDVLERKGYLVLPEQESR